MKKKLIFIFTTAVIILSFSYSNNTLADKSSFSLESLGLVATAYAEDGECREPQWFYGPCNQNMEEIQVHCIVSRTKRTYYESSTEVGAGWVLGGGGIQMIWGYKTGSYTDSLVQYEYDATRINCPTNGNSNTCEEYQPCF